MNKLTTFTTTLSILLLGVTGYHLAQISRLRGMIVHEKTVAQMDAITARAQAFMEVHYGSRFVNGGESSSYLKNYERTLRVPEDKKDEFTEWMVGYSVSPVVIDGSPSNRGSESSVRGNQLVYRVYYGGEPVEWRNDEP